MKAGDKVLCICALAKNGSKLGLIDAGVEYTIAGFCRDLVKLAGVQHPSCYCYLCHSSFGEYYSWRFIKLDPLQKETDTADARELLEILK